MIWHYLFEIINCFEYAGRKNDQQVFLFFATQEIPRKHIWVHDLFYTLLIFNAKVRVLKLFSLWKCIRCLVKFAEPYVVIHQSGWPRAVLNCVKHVWTWSNGHKFVLNRVKYPVKHHHKNSVCSITTLFDTVWPCSSIFDRFDHVQPYMSKCVIIFSIHKYTNTEKYESRQNMVEHNQTWLCEQELCQTWQNKLLFHKFGQ